MLDNIINAVRNRCSIKFQGEEASDIDITPMLDVVFIMLIFFIVTASFNKESGMTLNVPDSVKTNSPPKAAAIVLEVDANNQIKIQNQEVLLAAVKATIIRLKAESPNSAVTVILHPKSQTKTLVAVIDDLESAHINLPSISLKQS